MAINRLKDSMSIISELSDEPNDVDGLSSTELKAKFDTAGTIIKEFLNNSLIPDVEAEIVQTVSDTTVQSGNMPAGGAQGQALIKKSDELFDWAFKTIAEVPSGGVCGQVLTKGSDEDYDARFEDLPQELPHDWALIDSYTTAGTYTWEAPDLYADGEPYEIGAFIIGGGGGGGAIKGTATAGAGISFQDGGAAGGASGYTLAFTITVTPGTSYSGVVGSGGIGGNLVASTVNADAAGSAGGSSSFAGKTAKGGGGGPVSPIKNSNSYSDPSQGASGGQGSYPYIFITRGDAPVYGAAPILTYSSTTFFYFVESTPIMALNPFDYSWHLGAGGGVICQATSANVYTSSGQKAPLLVDGTKAGSGIVGSGAGTTIGEDATGFGNGGGAAGRISLIAGSTTPAASVGAKAGNGAPGAVFIYARRPVR